MTPNDVATNQSTSLLQWGIGGVVLAIFVVPVFYGMLRLLLRREELRGAAEEKERERRSQQEDRDAQFRAERERKLVDALVASVEQQKQALEQWRRFEDEERVTHQALIQGLQEVTRTLAQVGDRVAVQQADQRTTAAAQTQIAQLLGDVAQQIAALKKSA